MISAVQTPLKLYMLSAGFPLRICRAFQAPKRTYSANSGPEDFQYPDSPRSQHHDIPSFLEYASRTNMNPGSPTYVGTHFEYTVRTSLERLGMSLKRIGGKSDYGIDLLGTWSLPSVMQPLKVFVQCKAFAVKLEPKHARELEGTFVGAPHGWRGPGALGLLVSQNPATKGIRETISKSKWPMGFVMCRPDGKILQMLWNRRANQEGLEGIDVSLRYAGGDVNEKEVVLTWKGDAFYD